MGEPSSVDLPSAVIDELGGLGSTFHPDELAYLALTSKIELPIRDRLAYRLSQRFPDLFVAREWYRFDLAVLSEAGVPLLLLEAKALYTFDMVGEADGTWVARYPQKVKADIEKSIRSARRTPETQILALILVTHPKVPPPARLSDVAKYWSGIRRAYKVLETAEAIHDAASANLEAKLSELGPIHTGSMSGGSAYEVEVDVDYWVVGPVGLGREQQPADADEGRVSRA